MSSQPAGATPVTVTYLAMREAGALPAARPVTPAGATTECLRPCPLALYRELYDRVGRPWHWLDRKRTGDAELSAILQDPGVEVHLLKVDGEPAGYAELDRRKGCIVDIAYFGLMPEFIGRGLGPWLLYRAIELAWQSRPIVVTVNTCTLDHPSALGLYLAMGFRAIGERRTMFDLTP
ncbi:MAG: GNAT family N-acetyltransferase [Alphaproteobacteria bacterium]|nr:GNAT family N-acetyltransferase [Alphaproteobacteria bacterium]